MSDVDSETGKVYVYVGLAYEQESLKDYVVCGDPETAKNVTPELFGSYTPRHVVWNENKVGRFTLEVDEWANASAEIVKTPLLNPKELFQYE